ncbi:MAG TPA: DUF2490 domain-containing protein [Flavobacteriales bacterium]|nr:DUF2490 domain-containing protein [Flavobacteriales bacterium]
MKKSLLLLALCVFTVAKAQHDRINTRGSIGWFNYFGTVKLSEKWGLHTEYQWRRDQVVAGWQQSLLRVGINHQLTPSVLLRGGYGWIETYPYGELPINGLGRAFTEHRLFQMAQLTSREGRLEFAHRFMLEQRFVGRYSRSDLDREDEYPLLHRARYMLRLQLPLKGPMVVDHSTYVAVYNELFIGFGHQVNANVFDQNRFGALIGHRFSPLLRIEGGYLNQVLQFGREIQGRNVFQYNQGIILNALFTFAKEAPRLPQ